MNSMLGIGEKCRRVLEREREEMDREWNGRPFIGGEREWDGGRENQIRSEILFLTRIAWLTRNCCILTQYSKTKRVRDTQRSENCDRSRSLRSNPMHACHI